MQTKIIADIKERMSREHFEITSLTPEQLDNKEIILGIIPDYYSRNYTNGYTIVHWDQSDPPYEVPAVTLAAKHGPILEYLSERLQNNHEDFGDILDAVLNYDTPGTIEYYGLDEVLGRAYFASVMEHLVAESRRDGIFADLKYRLSPTDRTMLENKNTRKYIKKYLYYTNSIDMDTVLSMLENTAVPEVN